MPQLVGHRRDVPPSAVFAQSFYRSAHARECFVRDEADDETRRPRRLPAKSELCREHGSLLAGRAVTLQPHDDDGQTRPIRLVAPTLGYKTCGQRCADTSAEGVRRTGLPSTCRYCSTCGQMENRLALCHAASDIRRRISSSCSRTIASANAGISPTGSKIPCLAIRHRIIGNSRQMAGNRNSAPRGITSRSSG